MILKLHNCFNDILDIQVLSGDNMIWPQDPHDDKLPEAQIQNV